MPFHATFDCLWCGDPWTVRDLGDLEGWALLCGTCLGRAGSNAFLRARLRTALAERAAARSAGPASSAARPAAVAPARPRRRTGAPTAAFPDDWFLRRGTYERGAIHDTAWAAELDMLTRWLDDLPPAARIAEPAAGVGFFSPLLAARGELHCSDADGAALGRARERLLAHGLRAHLHDADPWVVPAGDPVDLVVASFLVGRVRGAGLDPATASLRARLRPGGTLALIDLHPDPAGGPPDGIAWSWHEPPVLEAALARAGFEAVRFALTGRFFFLGTAIAG